MFNSWQNYIVFKTTSLSNEDTPIKGEGGKKIVIDTTYDPKKHTNCKGEVVSVPKHLSDMPISQKHLGIPSYNDRSPFGYKTISDISMEIGVGDTIYFHFNTIIDKNLIKVEGLPPNRTWYFKVRYDQVICSVRDGKITPNSSYILVDPDMETWDDILIPTRSNIMGKDGKPMLRPKDQWIQAKTAPQKKFLLGFVRHVGTPWKGDTCDVVPGDRIIYRRHSDWTNKIEGHDYFAILHKHLVGKFENGEPVPVGTNVFIKPEELPEVTETGVHLVKPDIVQRGEIIHPGKSKLKVGDLVELGEADRQPIEIDGKKFISVDIGYVWGIHLAKTA